MDQAGLELTAWVSSVSRQTMLLNTSVFFYYISFIYVLCACEWACVPLCLWRSGNDLWKAILSYLVILEIEFRSCCLFGGLLSSLYLMSFTV